MNLRIAVVRALACSLLINASLGLVVLADHELIFKNFSPAESSTVREALPVLSFTAEIDPPNTITQHFEWIIVEDGIDTPLGIVDPPSVVVKLGCPKYYLGSNGVTVKTYKRSNGDVYKIDFSVDLDEVNCSLSTREDWDIYIHVYTQEYTPPFPTVFTKDHFYTWTFDVDLTSPPSTTLPPVGRPNLGSGPNISSFSPTSVGPGDTVIINGSGFSQINSFSTTQNPTVLWDGNAIQSDYITSESLRIHVPQDATCEFHDVQVRNPALSGGLSSNVMQLKVACLPNQIANSFFDVRSVSTTGSVYVNEETTIEADVHNTGSSNGTAILKLYVDDVLKETKEISVLANASTLARFQYSFQNTGNRRVKVQSQDDFYTTNIGVSIAPPNEQPPNDEEPTPPPPVTGGNDLEDFDLNGDCVLSDAEFFSSIDAWIAEVIDDMLFFALVDSWIGQTNLCAAAAVELRALSVLQNNNAIVFSASDGKHIERLEIYSADGQLIYARGGSTKSIRWRLTTNSLDAVANGVYLYRVFLRDLEHERVSFEVHKLLVLR